MNKDILGMGTPWPMPDVVAKLVQATQHLLKDHDCDTHGWEEYRTAAAKGGEYVQALERIAAHPAAQVAGDRLEITVAQFVTRAQHLLIEEQEKPNPDNALVGFLCDAVRLAREHSREATAPIGRTCGWMRIPDSPAPMDCRRYRFKAGCSGAVATGVHPIYPDICPACARPVRLLNPSPNDVVRWICPVCSTVNDNRDERCCVGTCKGVRPNPWPPQAVKLIDWNVRATAGEAVDALASVAEIVRHIDLLLESGDEVASLTPDEWRRIKGAIGAVETSRDDAQDAARYRYLRERLACDRLAARKLVITTEGGREPYRTLREAELDREIDECIGLSVEPPEQLPLSSAKSTRRDMDRWFDGEPEKTTATLYETGWLPEHNAQPPPPEKASGCTGCNSTPCVCAELRSAQNGNGI